MGISIQSIRKALISAGAGLVLSGMMTGCMFGDKKPVATPPKQFGPGSAFPPQTQQPPLSQNKSNPGTATAGRFPGANTPGTVGVPGSPMLPNSGSPIVNNAPQRQMQPNNPALNPMNPPSPLPIAQSLNGSPNMMTIGSSDPNQNVILPTGGPGPIDPVERTPITPSFSNPVPPMAPPLPVGGQSIDSQSKSYQLPGTGLAPSPSFEQQKNLQPTPLQQSFGGRNMAPPPPSAFPQESLPEPPPSLPMGVSATPGLKLN